MGLGEFGILFQKPFKAIWPRNHKLFTLKNTEIYNCFWMFLDWILTTILLYLKIENQDTEYFIFVMVKTLIWILSDKYFMLYIKGHSYADDIILWVYAWHHILNYCIVVCREKLLAHRTLMLSQNMYITVYAIYSTKCWPSPV